MTMILKNKKWIPGQARDDSGLTLVEVIIAMAIFVTSFFVLIDAQNLNIKNSATSKKGTIATILAQQKLNEMLLQYREKPLSEIPEKEEGKFDEKYPSYRWEKTSQDFHYDLSFLVDMANAGKEEEGSEEEEPQSPVMTYLPKISDFIQKSAKEITVTVYWKEGSGERKVTMTTHLFNYKQQVAL
ncbi:MAG TPA: hypothetical protein DD708_03280 [Deltaproteobacteria bacterium]|nr:hypothetical protein [Deltaproteobacteria bacterium]